jgi:hypothetical protein
MDDEDELAWRRPPIDLLHSLASYTEYGARLHGLLAIYAHTPPQRRAGRLEELETLLLTLAAALAQELLAAGWTPDPEPAAGVA